jgi:hypothetical protein
MEYMFYSYWKKLGVCPKCDAEVGDETDFLRHIGVHHQEVIKYIPQRFRYK